MAGKGQAKTGGRTKGTPNATTSKLKTAIMNAFEEVGGQSYLVSVAHEDPKTFCTLLGKVLPQELKAELSGKDGKAIELVVKRQLISCEKSS
ncbi:hypothetical protein [Curvivirga aplysinae]|uniref:hypothetical protein n=1 Tax=Curvivirga aplysinae TaxID=2529852 RepID=UPI0012BC3458|nr:hypothetical protein [Curvivirga aplysinae]MTI10199.1 hypothetical protein [Curvivirga aplysinae]